jgi:hypothetical protein
MKSVPHLSSQDGSGRVQLEGFGPTRNRKVVGSNPTSGSISAGERPSSKTSPFRVDQAVATSRVVLRRCNFGLTPHGAERLRRAVRFARLIQRRGCVLGGPAGCAAPAAISSRPWLPRRVVPHNTAGRLNRSTACGIPTAASAGADSVAGAPRACDLTGITREHRRGRADHVL